jgi:hypothetical protein
MTIPKLTDDAVSRLPLEAGRAELLEEIMSTVAPDRETDRQTDRHARRWLAPLAVAAVVAGIAASSLWWHGTGGQGGADHQPAHRVPVATQGPATTPEAVPTSSPAAVSGFRAVLDAPGWEVSSTESEGTGFGGVSYQNGKAWFEITWYAASSYASYVEDREHIVDPPAAGEPVEVMGGSGQLWAYSAHDHTVIREVENGHWMELRGAGIDEAAYRALLGQLRLVDLSEFEAALPARFVTDTERASAVDDLLQGIESASGADYPVAGTPSPKSDQQDPYQLGAAVAGSYACAWLTEFEQATQAGDAARAAEAARVLGTSRDWPVLNDMNASGDYPETIWEYADDVAAGQVPEGYRDGLGCR